jgi:outer membrane protein assembly factor BamB
MLAFNLRQIYGSRRKKISNTGVSAVTRSSPISFRTPNRSQLLGVNSTGRSRKMKSRPIPSCALALFVAGMLISACGETRVPVSSTPILAMAGKAGSFDAIEIDQAAHLLYMADRTDRGVDVFDISTPRAKYLQTIPMPSYPNGLAIAKDLARLYVGTAAGSVAIVDINTSSKSYGAVIKDVKTAGTSVDLLDYGATRQRLYASNSTDGKITSIDPSTGEIKAQFTVGSITEQPRFNPADGMVYVTSPAADALVQIDPNDGLVKNKYPLEGCKPVGMAINPSSNTALMACHTYVMSFDLGAGKSTGTFPLGNGDIVNYSASVDRFFVASLPHAQTPGFVGIFGGNPVTYLSSVQTDGSGNSAAYDEKNNVVYTPDIRPKTVGLASFRMPDAQPLPPVLVFLAATWPYAVVLAMAALLIYFLARSADPIRRPVPEQKAAPPKRSSLSPGK